jgi:hypothetical protein
VGHTVKRTLVNRQGGEGKTVLAEATPATSTFWDWSRTERQGVPLGLRPRAAVYSFMQLLPPFAVVLQGALAHRHKPPALFHYTPP